MKKIREGRNCQDCSVSRILGLLEPICKPKMMQCLSYNMILFFLNASSLVWHLLGQTKGFSRDILISKVNNYQTGWDTQGLMILPPNKTAMVHVDWAKHPPHPRKWNWLFGPKTKNCSMLEVVGVLEPAWNPKWRPIFPLNFTCLILFENIYFGIYNFGTFWAQGKGPTENIGFQSEQ